MESTNLKQFNLLPTTFSKAVQAAIFAVQDDDYSGHVMMKTSSSLANCIDLATGTVLYMMADRPINIIPHHLIPRYLDSLGVEFFSEED